MSANLRSYCTRMRVVALITACCLLAAPGAAFAHGERTAGAAAAAAPDACPGDPIAPSHVVTGELPSDLQGSYVLAPFDVPAGTTAVRVKYCHDQPEAPTTPLARHTLDLGLYQARTAPGALYGPAEFRGWGGSSHPDVTVSPEGFSSEEQYRSNPKGHVPGKTTRGFRPGPIPAGEWAVELGVGGAVPPSLGDTDGRVAWRVEIELSSDPAFADEPYQPLPYDTRPASSGRGWYAGDLHVHAEHSALGDATMSDTFDYAFRPRSRRGAGLDFVTLSDYVTDSAWGEIARHQQRYPDKLIARSAEVITYRGHANNHVSGTHVDYRAGPIYERLPDGTLELRRGPRAPSQMFDEIHAAGGFTQINHPAIFPPTDPLSALFCRGCAWSYSDAETDYSKVDAYEVHTGPAASPFTSTAIRQWDRKRRQGFRLTAVAASDSHHAGRPRSSTQSPIGVGTTVVYADELSEQGIRRAVLAGHVYVKVVGPGGPDLRLEARPAAGGRRAIMGDRLVADSATVSARVVGARGRTLLLMRDGAPFARIRVTRGDFRHRFLAARPGDYRLQVERGTQVEALTNPITLAPCAPTPPSAARIRLTVSPATVPARRRTRFTFRATGASPGRSRPVAGATVRFAGRAAVTDRRGRAAIVASLRSPGRHRAAARLCGLRSGTAVVRAVTSRRGRR